MAASVKGTRRQGSPCSRATSDSTSVSALHATSASPMIQATRRLRASPCAKVSSTRPSSRAWDPLGAVPHTVTAVRSSQERGLAAA